MANDHGHRIVLTADRLLMADYACLFDAMVAASQTTTTPRLVLERLLMPAPRPNPLPAKIAPLGLRRIEAALHSSGLVVSVCHPDRLADAVGPDTRVVGIATGEPLGKGMNSSTMEAIAGGRIWPQVFFEQVLKAAHTLAPHAQFVIGGPGAWQIAQSLEDTAGDTGNLQSEALDLIKKIHLSGRLTVVEGYCEGNIAEAFGRVLESGQGLGVFQGKQPERVPAIRNAATMGAVEMSRGCGWGCAFCTIAREPMRHLPLETIESDADRNLAGGQLSLSLLSEDFFRYGSTGLSVNPEALIKTLARLRENKALRLMQIDHVNVSSIARFSDADLVEVHRLLTLGQRHRYVWVNIGVETASGPLLARNGGRAKMAGCPPEEWYSHTQEQMHRLVRAGFYPLVSLVLGLETETPDEARLTLEWVRGLRNQRLSVFPVMLAPLGHNSPLPALTKTHWQTVIESYRLNFKWVPRLVWDNEQGAGVPVARRLAAQAIGKGQVLWWNAAFQIRKRRAHP